jgi:hypothetical protein
VRSNNGGHDASNDALQEDGATLAVLLIDDSESQAARLRACLAPYRIRVEWRPCYRAAAELLRRPEAGQLIDLILIDQAFDSVPDDDLLTCSDLDTQPGAEEWDVVLHQGLFILARLGRDLRDGLIPAAPMMILTHYPRAEIAAQIGLAGYESKRRLLSDPYRSLKHFLPGMRPTEADVERSLNMLAPEIGLDGELLEHVKQRILGGLDVDEVCATLLPLSGRDMHQSIGRALDRLADEL